MSLNLPITPSTPVSEIIDAAYRGVFDKSVYHANWQNWDNVRKAHTAMLQEYHSAEPSVNPYSGSGRGIVISGGGEKYFPCAFASIYTLRAQGCILPIELWVRGEWEIDPAMRNALVPYNVSVKVATDFPQPRILAGWEMKIFAILNSAFDEVLLLDADNLVAFDPTPLFDTPQFRTSGAIIWPDLPPNAPRKEWIPGQVFDVLDIPSGPRRNVLPAESGQLLYRKSVVWKSLRIVQHLNNHSDFWYAPGFLYGDKDTNPLGFAVTGQPYSQPRGPGWRSPAILQHNFDGQIQFYHCCRGKDSIKHGTMPTHIHPSYAHANAASNILKTKWNYKVMNPRQDRATLEALYRSGATSLQVGKGMAVCRVHNHSSIYVLKNDPSFGDHLVRDGYWESWVTLAVLRHIQPDWVCVDVGANLGYYTLLFAQLAPRGLVIAVEPNPQALRLLEKSVAANDLSNVELVGGAVSDKEGECLLYESPLHHLNSTIRSDLCIGLGGPYSEYQSSVPVALVTLDMLAEWNRLDRVDFIKIDAEGSEHDIWRGSHAIREKFRPCIIMEFERDRFPSPEELLLSAVAYAGQLRYIDFDGCVKPTTVEEQLTKNTLGQMLWLDPKWPPS